MRRTKRVGPVTELLVDEDSACESTTWFYLDLSTQPSVPLYTKPKVTHKDVFARLPNELFDSILNRLEVPNLIPLRRVGTRWNAIIESICHKEKSLALVSGHFKVKTLHDRFDGQLDLSRLVYLKLMNPNSIKSTVDLRTLLTKLFPNVEHLFLDGITVSKESNFLVRLPSLWSTSLITLYFCGKFIFDLDRFSLNAMTSLKNLDMSNESYFPLVSLGPTLARLYSFSFGLFHSPQLTCDELANHLGPNCTRLRIDVHSCDVSLFDCWNWPARTAQSPIIHLHVNAFVPRLENFYFRVFPGHFAPTLRSLHITYRSKYPNLCSYTINPAMSRLTQLTNIRIDGPIEFRLSEFCLRDAIPMPNIRSFSLYSFWFYSVVDNPVELLCQFFSTIFPNLERLTLHYRDRGFGESIRPFLNLFKALCYHDISYVK